MPCIGEVPGRHSGSRLSVSDPDNPDGAGHGFVTPQPSLGAVSSVRLQLVGNSGLPIKDSSDCLKCTRMPLRRSSALQPSPWHPSRPIQAAECAADHLVSWLRRAAGIAAVYLSGGGSRCTVSWISSLSSSRRTRCSSVMLPKRSGSKAPDLSLGSPRPSSMSR